MNSNNISEIPITKDVYTEPKQKKSKEIDPVKINITKTGTKEEKKFATKDNKNTWEKEKNDELSFFFDLENEKIEDFSSALEGAKLIKETEDFTQNCDLYEEGFAELSQEYITRKINEIMPPVAVPDK